MRQYLYACMKRQTWHCACVLVDIVSFVVRMTWYFRENQVIDQCRRYEYECDARQIHAQLTVCFANLSFSNLLPFYYYYYLLLCDGEIGENARIVLWLNYGFFGNIYTLETSSESSKSNWLLLEALCYHVNFMFWLMRLDLLLWIMGKNAHKLANQLCTEQALGVNSECRYNFLNFILRIGFNKVEWGSPSEYFLFPHFSMIKFNVTFRFVIIITTLCTGQWDRVHPINCFQLLTQRRNLLEALGQVSEACTKTWYRIMCAHVIYEDHSIYFAERI